MPIVQMSTLLSYVILLSCLSMRISGARYSGVPHTVLRRCVALGWREAAGGGATRVSEREESDTHLAVLPSFLTSLPPSLPNTHRVNAPAKVCDQDAVAKAEEEVLRLEVAVDDVLRVAVL